MNWRYPRRTSIQCTTNSWSDTQMFFEFILIDLFITWLIFLPSLTRHTTLLSSPELESNKRNSIKFVLHRETFFASKFSHLILALPKKRSCVDDTFRCCVDRVRKWPVIWPCWPCEEVTCNLMLYYDYYNRKVKNQIFFVYNTYTSKIYNSNLEL